MVVIVIVGTLSAIALPSFLGQSLKAKATECNAKIGGLLSQVAQEAQTANVTKAEALGTKLAADWTRQSKNCTFAMGTTASDIMKATATGKGELLTKYAAGACQNYGTMMKGLEYSVASNNSETIAASEANTLLATLGTNKACDTVSAPG